METEPALKMAQALKETVCVAPDRGRFSGEWTTHLAGLGNCANDGRKSECGPVMFSVLGGPTHQKSTDATSAITVPAKQITQSSARINLCSLSLHLAPFTSAVANDILLHLTESEIQPGTNLIA